MAMAMGITALDFLNLLIFLLGIDQVIWEITNCMRNNPGQYR